MSGSKRTIEHQKDYAPVWQLSDAAAERIRISRAKPRLEQYDVPVVCGRHATCETTERVPAANAGHRDVRCSRWFPSGPTGNLLASSRAFQVGLMSPGSWYHEAICRLRTGP